MKNAFGTLIWVVAIGGSALMGACGDDDGGPSDTNGGEAAGGAGGEPSQGGKGGSGGKAGSGTTDAGAGGAAQAGESSGGAAQAGQSSGGVPNVGGAGEGGVGAGGTDVGGAPSAGGGGEGGDDGGTPALKYACTASSISHKLCSAYSAASCPEDFDCATCVADRKAERALFSECAACAAEFDKFFQCGVDAFESGNLAAGVECVPDYGPDMTFECYEAFDSAQECSVYFEEFSCPETWPLE